ncbi:hypothetical protein NPIL_7321 [Nephila pilipes]|uniref:Uncharacterized protein n=1 Tax=Nephila pilipes TaxID=299642 RepID=A0A8X6TXU1_NEPPI|nr:hypothetical protein NPIL_7321 [Nephila pilipes]
MRVKLWWGGGNLDIEINERLLKHKTLQGSFMNLLPNGTHTQMNSKQHEQMQCLVQKYQEDACCREFVALREFYQWYKRVTYFEKSPKSPLEARHMRNNLQH